MTSRSAIALAAGLLSLMLPVTAHAEVGAEKALQCAAMIEFSATKWPADHPSQAQAKALKAEWMTFAKTLSFPKTINPETEVAAHVSTIQSEMVSRIGDIPATQAYLTGLGTGCDALPYAPIAPSLCKALSAGEVEATESKVSMEKYNQNFDKTPLERIESNKRISDAKSQVTTAVKAADYFSTAEKMTTEALLAILKLSPEARKSQYETCLKQMG